MVRNWFSQILVVFTLAGLTFSALRLSAETPSGPGAPHTLRCEYMEDPLGVDTAEPRFAWVLEHSGRGETQTAFQVLVATK